MRDVILLLPVGSEWDLGLFSLQRSKRFGGFFAKLLSNLWGHFLVGCIDFDEI